MSPTLQGREPFPLKSLTQSSRRLSVHAKLREKIYWNYWIQLLCKTLARSFFCFLVTAVQQASQVLNQAQPTLQVSKEATPLIGKYWASRFSVSLTIALSSTSRKAGMSRDSESGTKLPNLRPEFRCCLRTPNMTELPRNETRIRKNVSKKER